MTCSQIWGVTKTRNGTGTERPKLKHGTERFRVLENQNPEQKSPT
jgi:hypothetical protein